MKEKEKIKEENERAGGDVQHSHPTGFSFSSSCPPL
jgi:hypothetical protein